MINSPAPDFTLPAWTAEGVTTLTLSEQRGNPVVLAFYPADNTPGCTKQLCSYQDDLAVLESFGAVLWGISSQGVDSHRRFAEKRGLTFPLLADEDKAVHDLYGAKGLMGLPKRTVAVVDANGVVRFHHASQLGLTHQSTETIARVLKELQPESR
jgi:peroxiredoxin Q/BCP